MIFYYPWLSNSARESSQVCSVEGLTFHQDEEGMRSESYNRVTLSLAVASVSLEVRVRAVNEDCAQYWL